MIPIQTQTSPHQSAGTDFNLRLAVSYFRHFAFLYNKYVVRSGWFVAAVDKVANRAIRNAIKHLIRNVSGGTLDRVAFLAVQSLYSALRGKINDDLKEPPPWDGVDFSIHFYGKTVGDDVQVLQNLVQSMTGVPVNLNRTPPLLANKPATPTTTPQGGHWVSPAKELDKLFQDNFIPPAVEVNNRGPVSMPPYSIPLPRAVNLARDVFNVPDKWIIPANLRLVKLRFCRDTHSIRVAVRKWTLERPQFANAKLENCPTSVKHKMIWVYGWLTTWLVDMHAVKKPHSMAEIELLYEKWRHDWLNFIDVIKPSEKFTTPKPAPTTTLATKIPANPSTGIEVPEILSLYIRTSVRDESLSLKEAKRAVLVRSKAVLDLLKELGIHLSSTKTNKELMENWRYTGALPQQRRPAKSDSAPPRGAGWEPDASQSQRRDVKTDGGRPVERLVVSNSGQSPPGMALAGCGPSEAYSFWRVDGLVGLGEVMANFDLELSGPQYIRRREVVNIYCNFKAH
ncbi:hypothetical protein B0T18DRAFT_392305 [Schizothecium vesticola]|uniref:Uncharacterized protein n=1 Tax=Schizothecium vesticola TaxID=314040 RepID=A0AA40K2L8_9PEZI|nr:hypothetical protein B0T18DRAFT_392305 [Schizothecium vesticola]